MASLQYIRGKAHTLARESDHADVRALAEVVEQLCDACEDVIQHAKDAEYDAKRAKRDAKRR